METERAASPILGSIQGLGIAGEVLKKQEEGPISLCYLAYLLTVTMSGLTGYIVGSWGQPEK